MSYKAKRNKEGYLDIPKVVNKRRKVYFINGDLVRVTTVSRAQGMVLLWNITRNYSMTLTMAEWKKKRKRAFTVKETAQLLNRDRKWLAVLATEGKIPYPVGALPDGERKWQHLSYYSEDTVFEMRKIMAQTHMGRPRKDGFVTNNTTPTEQELRVAMGDGHILFMKTEGGDFIPVFEETL